MSQEQVGNTEVDLDQILSEEYQVEQSVDMLEDSYADELDNPLAALTEEERLAYETIQRKLMQQDPVMEFFEQLETKPTQEQIDHWKSEVGEVYFAKISDSEHFVFRAIKRKEWRDLLRRLEQVKDPLKQDEAIVMKGVLHPKLDTFNVNILSAGTINTMKELIMQASNFLPPEYALQLVRKL